MFQSTGMLLSQLMFQSALLLLSLQLFQSSTMILSRQMFQSFSLILSLAMFQSVALMLSVKLFKTDIFKCTKLIHLKIPSTAKGYLLAYERSSVDALLLSVTYYYVQSRACSSKNTLDLWVCILISKLILLGKCILEQHCITQR